ncbi:MAG: hypothetical protein ACLS5Z_06530, partial [Clostridium fessum]
ASPGLTAITAPSRNAAARFPNNFHFFIRLSPHSAAFSAIHPPQRNSYSVCRRISRQPLDCFPSFSRFYNRIYYNEKRPYVSTLPKKLRKIWGLCAKL